jgi:cobalt/nickel transport system permease protein
MADALISPAVGATMWTASAVIVAYAAKKTGDLQDDRKIPIMGALGAFVFAAQMINFTIPATGSSGHLGGGVLLAALLGPHAAFLTIASILTIQALFFADGGILALGCNMFNMGFLACYVAYPLIFRPILSGGYTGKRVFWAAMVASVLGLQLGALGVVMEVSFSGITQLPTGLFLLLMQPIHFAIGIVEGFITAAVVIYVFEQRPELLKTATQNQLSVNVSLRSIFTAFLLSACIIAGGLSLFASGYPDGLEWSVLHANGGEELAAPSEGVYGLLEDLQKKVAIFPDYTLGEEKNEEGETSAFSTSVAGLSGVLLSFAAAFIIGKITQLIWCKKQQTNNGF